MLDDEVVDDNDGQELFVDELDDADEVVLDELERVIDVMHHITDDDEVADDVVRLDDADTNE